MNLSPYEKQRIVPDSFGKTDMGRDLLAQVIRSIEPLRSLIAFMGV